MKKYFAYERNPTGKLQPVIFNDHVPKQSSGGHVTEKIGIVELSGAELAFNIEMLTERYPEPRS